MIEVLLGFGIGFLGVSQILTIRRLNQQQKLIDTLLEGQALTMENYTALNNAVMQLRPPIRFAPDSPLN